MIYKPFIKYFLLLSLAGIGFSCNNGDNPEPDENGTLSDHRMDLAGHVADHFILPGYQSFFNEVTKLDNEVRKFGDNLTLANLQTVRQQLQVTWLNWQRIEMFQFGPAETFALRAAINTFPTNIQKIHANIAGGNYTLGTVAQLDAGGFPAIDYLLHDVSIGDDQVVELFQSDAGRITYLAALSKHILETTGTVQNQWTSSGYLQDFKSSENSGTDVGSSLSILINAMDVHFQRYLRDGKLAIPAGIRSAGVIRPTTTEAYYGGYSLNLLQAALESYGNLFEGQGIDGQSGFSLLDYLETLKRQDLAGQIQTALQLAIQQTAQLDDPLAAQIVNDIEPVTTLFLRLQDIVTLIKADVVSATGITITNQDTDGD